MKRAIVFGKEDMNALGLVQSLGREGVHVVTILIGQDSSGLIRHSKYSNEVLFSEDLNSGVELLLQQCVYTEPTVIFPSGDGAAMVLEQNRSRLQEHFKFEFMDGSHSIGFYMNKFNQYNLVRRHGFNVPQTVLWHKGDTLPSDDVPFPCIVKPLVSCKGDKRDILIAENRAQLDEILNSQLQFTTEVVIQQYLDRDYEYNMMGCSFSDGTVDVPLALRAVKFNSFLQNASTVCFVEPKDAMITVEVEKMKHLMQEIRYRGLFSFEFMHNRSDDKIYFTEINLRNDGLNSFIVNNGVNLPYLHYQDMLHLPRKKYMPTAKSNKFICEPRHFSALKRHVIPFKEWLGDLVGVKGFLFYYKDDKRPFFYQFINPLLYVSRRLLLRK